MRGTKTLKDLETVPVGFDLTVTHRDRYGKVLKHDPYTLIVAASPDGGRSRLYERPKNSGNVFNKRGEPIGRYVRDEKTKRGKYFPDAEHVEVQTPLSREEAYEKLTQDQAAKIKALEAELKSLEAEKKKAQKPEKGA